MFGIAAMYWAKKSPMLPPLEPDDEPKLLLDPPPPPNDGMLMFGAEGIEGAEGMLIVGAAP
jgi:hypothetical protein